MDRRKHQRFSINNTTMLVHGGQVGTLSDVSEGGFCCQCIVNGKEVDKPEQVNIYLSEINLRAIGIPIEVHSIHHQFGLIMENMKLRTCHGEFHNLSEAQKEQINKLLQSSQN